MATVFSTNGETYYRTASFLCIRLFLKEVKSMLFIISLVLVVALAKLVVKFCDRHNIDIPDPWPYDPAQYPKLNNDDKE